MGYSMIDVLNMLHHLSYNSGSALDEESRCNCTMSISSVGTPTSKSVAELIKEIATLEVEVMHLERHLLSLYRIAFEHHLPTLPFTAMDQVTRSYPHCKTGSSWQYVATPFCYHEDTNMQDFSNKKMVPPEASPVYVSTGSYSQSNPLSPKETSRRDLKNDGSGLCRLVDHFGAPFLGHVSETPDKLSEDIVICISSIYCKLTKPPPPLIDLSLSPSSSFSSSKKYLPKNRYNNWSPQWSEEVTVYPCLPEGLKEKNAVDAETIDVLQICLDDDSFNYAAKMLQHFRSLVQRLEKVDPTEMEHEEKLAFWINIHNALVMHAYLAYGIHHTRMKHTCLIQKAAYNVGGLSINPYVIQCTILGCNPHHSTSWLQTFFSSQAKPQSTSCRHIYALDYPEPLVHFALCSGGYSDPMVKVYSAKTVFGELNLAKDKFIQANVSIKKGRKVMLPKMLYYFAKDASLNLYGLVEFVRACLSEAQQKTIDRCVKGRPDKYIEWSPYNSAFRYRIHRELSKRNTVI